MRYFQTGWAGTGVDRDPYRPAGVPEGPYTTIDFRPDSTKPDGFCIVALPDDVTTIPGGRVLAASPRESITSTRRRTLSNAIGVNFDADSLDALLLELLTVQATPPGDKTRWNPITRTVDGRHEIWLGNEKVVDLPAVSGGATYTESFNKADSSTLGPDLTWSDQNGNLGVRTNKCELLTAFTVNRSRAQHDCATSNNYAQATFYQTGTGGGPFQIAETLCRYSSAADTAYGGSWTEFTTPDGWEINKVVTGAYTSLGTASDTTRPDGNVIKTSASGSTITVYKDSVSMLGLTDTAIASGTRGGLSLYAGSVRFGSADLFEMGDLPTSAKFWPLGPRGSAREAVRRAATW